MTAPDPIHGISWTPWTAADLREISGLLTAVEAHDNPSERHSLAELEEDFGSAVYDLGRDCRVGREPSGQVVAVARCICTDSDVTVRRALLAGAVAPDRRGRGIGRAVMAWQVAHARAWYAEHLTEAHGPLRLSVYSDSLAAGEQRLAERFGLRRARYYAELTRRLTGPVDVPTVPGIELVPLLRVTPAESLAVRNAAFRDHWGSVDRPLAGWQEQLESASFRPQWSFAAVTADGTVVGFLIGCAYEQDWEPQGYRSGYIDLLGTLADYRGRGIATALIAAAMAAFERDGMVAAEIGVDSESETGAAGLYASLGFAETSATIQLMAEETADR